MEDILHQLVSSLSHYLQGFIYIPGGGGFLPSTVSGPAISWEKGGEVPLDSPHESYTPEI